MLMSLSSDTSKTADCKDYPGNAVFRFEVGKDSIAIYGDQCRLWLSDERVVPEFVYTRRNSTR